jgi:predicted RNA-binding Zn ribbon-like protein
MDGGFRLDLGHPAVNLAATLARRLDQPRERLAKPTDLDRWLKLSGLELGGAHASQRDLAAARELREAIYLASAAIVGGRRIPRQAAAVINEWARLPALAPQLTTTGSCIWTGRRLVPEALASIARDAVHLLTGSSAARLRNCADPSCSLFFVDHSRAGRRRWCSMERCGNRSKTRTYRQRQRR